MRPTRGLTVALLAGLALVVGWAPAYAQCGPGAHWIDNCPTGTDIFDSFAQHGTVVINGVGQFPLAPMTGPVTIFRGPGLTIPDHHIDTELVSMTLTGGGLTLTAGDGVGNLLADGPLHSGGRITETGNPGLADSFFDIFFELSPTPLGPLHSLHPCHMQAIIDRVPPYEIPYSGCGGPIPLADQHGQVVGFLQSDPPVIHVPHRPVPEPSTMLLVGAGFTGLVATWRRRPQK